MAADFITIDKTKQHGNNTVRASNNLENSINEVIDLEAHAQRMWDTGDFTLLESKFGLTAGAGANFLTLLGNLKTALAAAAVTEFVNRTAGQ